MLKIYVARHGQNEDNANGILNGRRDLPLTDLGRSQAKEVAEAIKASGLTFNAVLSSPLKRALETAEIICTVNHLPKPLSMNELIERDYGAMTGIEQNRIEELCSPEIIKTATVTYFLSPDGAETFPDLLVRAEDLLAKVQKKYTDGSILLVTHGDLGKMIYAQYYHLDWRDTLRLFHFGNSELLVLSPDTTAEEAHVIKIQQHNL